MTSGICTYRLQIDASGEKIAQKTAELEDLSRAEAEAKEAVRAAKEELEKEKAALRERNKVTLPPSLPYPFSETNHTYILSLQELQKFEANRRAREKERAECSLRLKEQEHRITKFTKDSRDAAHKVRPSP